MFDDDLNGFGSTKCTLNLTYKFEANEKKEQIKPQIWRPHMATLCLCTTAAVAKCIWNMLHMAYGDNTYGDSARVTLRPFLACRGEDSKAVCFPFFLENYSFLFGIFPDLYIIFPFPFLPFSSSFNLFLVLVCCLLWEVQTCIINFFTGAYTNIESINTNMRSMFARSNYFIETYQYGI